jgi:hypothetical protein
VSSIARKIKPSPVPAAGAEVIFTADEDMVVHSLRFNLTTSGVAGNRFVTVIADDGGTNEFFRVADATGRAASATYIYSLFEGAPSSGLSAGFGLPASGLRLLKGDRVLTVTSGKDVGDQYTKMILNTEGT